MSWARQQISKVDQHMDEWRVEKLILCIAKSPFESYILLEDSFRKCILSISRYWNHHSDSVLFLVKNFINFQLNYFRMDPSGSAFDMKYALYLPSLLFPSSLSLHLLYPLFITHISLSPPICHLYLILPPPPSPSLSLSFLKIDVCYLLI